MMKLSTKIIITVAVLMFSAVQSYASETCAADVNTCTPKQLCEASTSIVNNNKVWSVDPAYVKHVAMSKQLGINCGVVDVVAPTCETNAELCAVSALCEQATVASGSAKVWSEAAGKAGHVSLAKEYGLACDVLVAEVNKACSYDNPAGCDDRVLCLRSISKGKWDQRPKYLTTVDEAQKRGLTCGVGGGFKANYADAFKSQSLLKRQQLQYALKKLGFYSSSVDGLWGKGTSSAIVEYAQANGVNSSSPSSVFSTILSKVDVPTSFSTPEKIVTKAKTGSEFVCKTNKIYVKSSLFEISTNTGMTKIEVRSEGQKKQLTSTEAKAAIKEFQVDEPMYLKFNDDKVSFNNPQFNDKKISELLESESPENRAALKKAVQQVMAPKTYKINNNVASWSLRFPKVLDIGIGVLDNSFNLETHQYIVRTKMNISGMDEINMTLWATCSLY